MNKIISIDPGKDKCGMLLVDENELIVLEGKVVDSKSVIKVIEKWEERYQIKLILLGDGTTSNIWQDKIKLTSSSEIKLFKEESTTLRAKYRYLELWPRKDFSRFIPKGLFLPSEPLDAVAALILLEDYLDIRLKWPKKNDFKIWHE